MTTPEVPTPYDIVCRSKAPAIRPVRYNLLSRLYQSLTEGASAADYYEFGFVKLRAGSPETRTYILSQVAAAGRDHTVSRFVYMDTQGETRHATVLAARARRDLEYPDLAFTLFLKSEPIAFDDLIAG